MKIMTKIYIYYILVLTFSLNILSCGNNSEDKGNSEKIELPSVKICNPTQESISEYFEVNGQSKFLKKEIIRSKITGFITKIYANINDNIDKNKTLFAVQSKEAEAINQILDSSVSEKSILIKSKVSGIITSINFENGSFVQEGDILAEISEPQTLVFVINIPFEISNSIKINMPCTVIFPDNSERKAFISGKLPTIDNLSQTQSFFVTLSEFEQIPENLNVLVKFTKTTHQNSLVLPTEAILTNEAQDKFWVTKIINDTLVVNIDIQKGIRNKDKIEILSPKFSLTDKIAVKGAYGLPDSTIVKIIK